MTFAATFGWMALQQSFGHEYGVQDDARQHVFWMLRFRDPELFPNDWIADYFQSVAPWGYTSLYRGMAMLGLDPFLLNKLLPPVLGLITTAYCFGVCLQLLPIPMAGFMASLLLNQSLLLADDLSSGTPRAFIYPLFLAFLYYLLRGSPILCGITVCLLGLFYPQMMLVACGVLILRLFSWRDGRLRLVRDRDKYLLSGIGLAIGLVTMLVYVLKSASDFGPVIQPALARQMSEFWGQGRGSFFSHNPFDYWLLGDRSGMLPRLNRLLKPPFVLTALALPYLLRKPEWFPMAQKVTENVQVLVQMLLASLGLFVLAHLLLFKLHHPSRYTQHSVRIVLALAGGIALTILLDQLLQWTLRHTAIRKKLIGWGTATLVSFLLAIYPMTHVLEEWSPIWQVFVPLKVLPGFVVGRAPTLYQFFAQQPKDSLIASLSRESDNLPSFAHRSILVSKEYGLPYHLGYYTEFQKRAQALIRAHYSPDLAEVRRFTEEYGIDFWLVDRTAFTPKVVKSYRWLRQFQPATADAIANLEQGKIPVVQQAIDRCSVFNLDPLAVLPAACVVNATSNHSQSGNLGL
jgi:hypothetical protein